MTLKTSFVVQPFAMHRNRLRPAQSEIGAPKKAEALAARLPGAAALKSLPTMRAVRLEGVTILGQLGNIPDDFAKTLQGG